MASVDATEQRVLAQEAAVQGFPTIKLYIDGQFVEDYNGGRDLNSLYDYLKTKKPVEKVESTLAQLKGEDDLKENCLKAPLCVLSFLPHLLDCDAACRNKYISILEKEAKEGIASGRGWRFLWSEGAQNADFEERLGLGPGVGYPNLAVLNGKKGRYAAMRGAFQKEAISEFLKAVVYGRQSVQALPANLAFQEKKLEAWDGKDFVAPAEDGDSRDEL